MGLSASGCQVIGGATANIKWYENLGPARPLVKTAANH
jgi:hypothetical protein